MTPDRWQQVNALLDAVLDAPPSERDAVLEAECDDPEIRAEVESLLEAEANAPDFLEGRASDMADDLVEELPARPPVAEGDRIGPYRLKHELGRGGMSVVYEAERADGQYQRDVALKVLPRHVHTPDRVARFRAERQILASLDHPGIARLLDGGVTEAGRPYLVMEKVDGVPITDYCAATDASIEKRLQLFISVCDAVQYAHRQLVVHRDLKPENIFVRDTRDGPEVKLLDFGIAKLLDTDALGLTGSPATRTGEYWFTPHYAAPEQVDRGGITTATDVYQLGVLAFELLAGQRPFNFDDVGWTDVQHTIREVTPDRPSTVAEASGQSGSWVRTLRGDLDTIVTTALRKEPDRRYRSAEAMAADVQRFLDGKPITARPATVSYRLRKFVRRNRASVTAGVLVVLLIAGFVGALVRQQAITAQERDRAEEVTAFLTEVLRSPDPFTNESLGRNVTVREALDRGVRRLPARLNDQPVLRARLLGTIASVYENLGVYDRARDLQTEVLALYRQEEGPSSDQALNALQTLAQLHRKRNALDAAEALAYEHQYRVQERYGSETVVYARSQAGRGRVEEALGRLDVAERLYRAALSGYRAHGTDVAPEIAETQRRLARVLVRKRRLAEARRTMEASLDAHREIYGDEHPKTAIAMRTLSNILHTQGRYPEAERLKRRALTLFRAQLGMRHILTLETLNDLALDVGRQGRHAEAVQMYRVLLDLRIEKHGRESKETADTRQNLAVYLLKEGETREAQALLDTTQAIYDATLPEGHYLRAYPRLVQAQVALDRGQYAEALPPARAARRIAEGTFGPEHVVRQTALRTEVRALRATGRRSTADSLVATLPGDGLPPAASDSVLLVTRGQ